MEQRLSVVTLGVSDLARARAFYEALGRQSATRACSWTLTDIRGRSPTTRIGRLRLTAASSYPAELGGDVRSGAQMQQPAASAGRLARTTKGRLVAALV